MKAKLKDVKEDFYAFSGATSSIYRQLALAGLAIIWLFKKETNGQIQITSDLIVILKLLIISLVFDFCHAFIPSIVYGIMNFRFRRKGKEDDSEIEYSQGWTIPEWIFFVLKIVFLTIAYVKLWSYLTSQLI